MEVTPNNLPFKIISSFYLSSSKKEKQAYRKHQVTLDESSPSKPFGGSDFRNVR